jgi:hypothetical protein
MLYFSILSGLGLPLEPPRPRLQACLRAKSVGGEEAARAAEVCGVQSHGLPRGEGVGRTEMLYFSILSGLGLPLEPPRPRLQACLRAKSVGGEEAARAAEVCGVQSHGLPRGEGVGRTEMLYFSILSGLGLPLEPPRPRLQACLRAKSVGGEEAARAAEVCGVQSHGLPRGEGVGRTEMLYFSILSGLGLPLEASHLIPPPLAGGRAD